MSFSLVLVKLRRERLLYKYPIIQTSDHSVPNRELARLAGFPLAHSLKGKESKMGWKAKWAEKQAR